MSRVALFCLTLSGVATTLFAQAGGISIETYKGLYQVGGILYYNPPTEEGTPGQMTAATQYQGGGDPFSDPSGSTDPSPFGDPSMYSNPGEGGDPYGVMDPFMGGSDPLADPYGGVDQPMLGGGGGVGGIGIQTYQGLFQVNGGLYYNPPTEEGTPGQMTATTQYQGGGDPFSGPSGSIDPAPFKDPSMYLVPGSGSDDPYFRVDPFMVGSDPYSDPYAGMDPTMVGGSDPFSDPFGGSDPEFKGTAGRVRLRLPYTAY